MLFAHRLTCPPRIKIASTGRNSSVAGQAATVRIDGLCVRRSFGVVHART